MGVYVQWFGGSWRMQGGLQDDRTELLSNLGAKKQKTPTEDSDFSP